MITLRAKPRGFHLITNEISQALILPETGLLLLTIMHTSAGLTINENADIDVRLDFESIFNRLVPENINGLLHSTEGPDDMPAHIKTSMVGTTVHVPIANHHFLLGTWQGIYLCEFRNNGGARKLTATIIT